MTIYIYIYIYVGSFILKLVVRYNFILADSAIKNEYFLKQIFFIRWCIQNWWHYSMSPTTIAADSSKSEKFELEIDYCLFKKYLYVVNQWTL